MSFVLFFGSILVGLRHRDRPSRACSTSRIKPDKVYRLYGFHYGVHRSDRASDQCEVLDATSSVTARTSSTTCAASGTSSPTVVQTGRTSAAGQAREPVPELRRQRNDGRRRAVDHERRLLEHVLPRVPDVDRGAATSSATTSPIPRRGRTGDNCLLATKVMVPIDGRGPGECRAAGLAELRDPAVGRARQQLRPPEDTGTSCAAASPPRTGTTSSHRGVFLLVRWFFVFVLTVLTGTPRTSTPPGCVGDRGGHVLLPRSSASSTGSWSTASSRGSGRCRPQFCSIYDLDFWRHERYWKVPSAGYLAAFNGTPFMNMIWRMVGVRIGQRVFDDGCGMTESGRSSRSATTARSTRRAWIQCHSQEDGAFKSDCITIGSDCTLGVGAHVHYGVTIGDGADARPRLASS